MTKQDDYQQADADGQFRRPESKHRNTIPSAQYPAQANRYVLYFNYGCPWAQRTNIIRTFKGSEDIIELVEVDDFDPVDKKGWYFSGKFGPDKDPVTGVKYLRELYEREDETFTGRATVPLLWDKVTGTVVNNESAEILRMLSTAFDDLLPELQRESTKGARGLYPEHLRSEIDEMNAWIYDTINNGVYKCGFATTQEAYNENIYPIFDSLDRLEAHLADPKYAGQYLFGENITETDIRLFPTLVRFDGGYYQLFKCNLKMIRYDYPNLHKWLRTLYWDESESTRGAFNKTTKLDRHKLGYSKVKGDSIVPAGPIPAIYPL